MKREGEGLCTQTAPRVTTTARHISPTGQSALLPARSPRVPRSSIQMTPSMTGGASWRIAPRGGVGALTVRLCAPLLLLRPAGCSLLCEGGANDPVPAESGRLRSAIGAAAAAPALRSRLAIAANIPLSGSTTEWVAHRRWERILG